MENEHIEPVTNSNTTSNKQTFPLAEVDALNHTFSYDGYQVVRGEFFAHVYEPSITFNNCKVSLNTACLNRLPNVDYVQILVNPEDKKLAVRPSNENEKDSFLWCTSNGTKRKPKQITCRMFFAKVVQLMGWNPNYRYKLLGKLIKSGAEFLFISISRQQKYISVSYKTEKRQRPLVHPPSLRNGRINLACQSKNIASCSKSTSSKATPFSA